MQQTILSLLTACMTDLKATASDIKPGAALAGNSPFGALLSRAMNAGSLQGAGGAGQVTSSSPLDLSGFLSLLLGNDAAASGAAAQSAASPVALQTTGNEGLKTSAGAAGGTGDDEKTEGAGTKPVQQLQDLIMGLVALVIMKSTGAGDQTASAVGSDSGEEKAAAEQGNGITTGGKNGDDDGPSQRSKASSNSDASNSASQTDNQHLLNTVAVLLFAGLEAITQEPAKESGASGETQPLVPKGGRAEAEGAAAPASVERAADGAGMRGPETVASPGDDLKGFAARLLDAGTDATAPTATATAPTGTTAVRAGFALTPAGEAGPDGNSLTLQISVGNAGASGQARSRAGETAGSVQDGAAAGAEGTGSASSEAVVTIVKELTPLLFEGRDENGSHDKAAGSESPGAKGVYPLTPDEHVSMNNEPAQGQQVSGQPAVAGTIERFDRVMEQVGSGTGQHDLTVRLTVGNGESLVLGMKDLGQTVTVEVRGSSQGMINLLQSQRDVIISHLEGKDISANIVIDPNASGTSEKRDRRETRQRTPAARAKVGGGFDGLLEVFA
jgi:hypothetical protein